ncbi:MAG: hypothetical protein GXP39_01110 [Chloroflexi bacterium]|nr:hypothetical protein [Chloroflexota bacterium]
MKTEPNREKGWLLNFIKRFALENEIPYQLLGNGRIALTVRSRFHILNIIFQVRDDNDGYEHFTPILEVPKSKRKAIAEAAISEAYREIAPVLPYDDDRLLLYGSARGLKKASEIKIRDGILDVMGRVVGYDNEKHPIFRQILSH